VSDGFAETDDFVDGYVGRMRAVLAELDAVAVERLGERLLAALRSGAQVLVAGNGGSAATAMHLACDLGKTLLGPAPDASAERLRVIALGTNVSLLTAWANDAGYETVFAEEVRLLGREGDLLLVVTVSGDSPNVLAAVAAARERGLAAVGLLGGDGGAVRGLLDDYVLVADDDFGHVESAHVVLGHLLMRWLAARVAAG
jgi:D-sedoheptulose 7-phosphate isomerase